MNSAPVYVDQEFGMHPPRGSRIGLTPSGCREYRNHSTAPLLAAPPLLVLAFLFSWQSLSSPGGVANTIYCIVSAFLLLILLGVLALNAHSALDRGALKRSVTWFDPEVLGLTDEQRIRMIGEVEAANNLRDEQLNERLCAKLQGMHQDAVWLTENTDSRQLPEFRVRQERIAEAVEAFSEEVQEGVFG